MIGYCAAPVLIEGDHAFGIARRLAGLVELVTPVACPELARRDIERDEDVLAGLVAGLADRFEHDFDRFAIGLQAGRKAALVADAGREAARLQDRAQRVKDLDAGAQSLAERVGKPTGITMNS